MASDGLYVYILTDIGHYVSVDIARSRGRQLIGGAHQSQVVRLLGLHVLQVALQIRVVQVQVVL